MAPRPDLPQLLIQTGMDILDEDGTEGLTLRRIAARAGVSHAAPAHHFGGLPGLKVAIATCGGQVGGLPGLKVAIATCGFQSFLDHLNAARDGMSDSDPFQRLLGVNLAYIQFASSRRGLFRLMFDQLSTQDPELGKIALGSYFVLKQMCAPFVQGRPAAALETAVWGLTHGYAALNMGRRRPPNSPLELSSYEAALRLLIG